MLSLISQLEQDLDQCLRKDQFPLRKQLARVGSDYRSGKEVRPRLEELAGRLRQSIARKEARHESTPTLTYPEDLPISENKDRILQAILGRQTIIVCGETGSGKTTQLPKICLAAGRGRAGYIGHTQPRRIAARTVAARIAEELKEPIGRTVGYKIRFHDETREDSLIKLMTDGILLAETQVDPYLDHYDTLIIDEAHERSLNIDFLLGYLKWLLPKRPDLKLIITSATLDPERLSRHFNDAPIVEVSGRTYPVEIRYRPVKMDEGDETDRDEQQAILDAVAELFREQAGDILIFLSGEREIRETAESLRKRHPADCEILPLYARLSAAEQERVFRPHAKRRIVLATNVAETSLTVPGIRCVIDTGYVRISRYSPRSKLQRLPIEKISQASAQQRAGRCGRVGPGICVRLYGEDDFAARPEFTDPEILRTNLAAVVLQMTALKLGDISAFPFVELPDERLVRDGIKTLQELNAIDEQRNLTAVGEKLAKLPLDPRLGRMLLAAAEENCLLEVSIIVAALSLNDPRERPLERAQAADEKHARFRHEQSDFLSLLSLWQDYEAQKKHLSNNKLRQYCRENFLSYVRMREWQDIHQQIMQVVKGELKLRENQLPADYGAIHRALLTGLLGNIGLRQEQAEYLGARGLKFQIHPGSSLYKVKPKWIVAGEQVETTRIYGRFVARIEPDWIEACGAHLIKRQYYDPHWERKAARVAVHERTSLFGIVVQSGRKVPYERVDAAAAREIFIRSALVGQDYDSCAPFFLHNRKLLEDAHYIQQKGRRVDLIADDEWIYAFYDERIPDEVVNGITFERWRKQAEKKNPDLLRLTRADITRQEDARVDERNFPDELLIGDLRLKTEYRFEPGHEEDGVSVLVPLHQLNQLTEEPFEWLVPGLLREKVVALIRGLPKAIRKRFVPAPDYADRCLALIAHPQGSLHAALGQALRRIGNLPLPDEVWKDVPLPPHLQMNFRLVDERCVVIAHSRDLNALQQAYGKQAVQEFQTLTSHQRHITGRRDWDFGDLPRTLEMERQGNVIRAFPALVDEGETVGVGMFDTDEEAQAQHSQGLLRLYRQALARELKYLKRNLSVNAAQELVYRQLPAHPLVGAEAPVGDLREDLLDRTVETLFLADPDPIRSREAFIGRLQARRAALVPSANEIADTVSDVLSRYGEIRKKFGTRENADATIEDVREQLDLMVYAGFVRATPFPPIKAMPRYLKAIQYRLEKAAYDQGRDLKQLSQLRPLWNAYWKTVQVSRGNLRPELDAFRWSLEEFRISLFAQTLKTAYPVSSKRLEEAWAERTKQSKMAVSR
jgi:ATP-dependent helicase HrpA